MFSKKKFKCILSLTLVMVFVFQSIPAFSSHDMALNEWILHHKETNERGEIVEQLYEFGGSIFFSRATDEFLYSSQLTPLGYYDFALRRVGSDYILNATLPLTEVFALDASIERSMAAGATLSNSEALSLAVVENLDKIDFETIFVRTIYHEGHRTLDLIEAEEARTQGDSLRFGEGISPFNTSLIRPTPHPYQVRGRSPDPFNSLSALIQTEMFPRYTDRLAGSLMEQRGGIMGNVRMYETYWPSSISTRSFAVFMSMTVSAIALLLGIITGTAAIATVISLRIGAQGVIFAARDYFKREHFIVTDYIRIVTVNGSSANNSYYSMQTIRQLAISGDRGFTIDDTQWPTIHRTVNPANHNTPMNFLLQFALNNFFRRFGL